MNLLRYLLAANLLSAFLFASVSQAALPQFGNDQFQLRFAADGRVSSFMLSAPPKELLNAANPGTGFYLKGRGDSKIVLTNLTMEPDGRMVAKSENSSQQVVFRVAQAPTYVAFHIERLIGIPTTSALSLYFEMNCDPSVKIMGLGFMTQVSDAGATKSATWDFLWHRNPADPMGGFALYVAKSPDEQDDRIIEIVVGENLPHPKVKGEWNVQAAKKWVADWIDKFSDQSMMLVEGTTIEELRESADFAEKADIREIYLMPWIWRGAYWPTDMTNYAVNKKIFPRGEKDLLAYSEFLAKRGMYMGFHYCSGTIGFQDPVYMGEKIDRRIATWGAGTLAADIGTSDTTITIRPAPGTQLPAIVPWGAWMGLAGQPGLLYPWTGIKLMRIGEELVIVGDFEDTDKPVWKLTKCTRGAHGKKAVPHPAGEDSAGIIVVYDQCLVFDNDSTLVDETAQKIAELLNRCKVSNFVYDGLEVNCYNGTWGGQKFPAKVYEQLDHPVRSSSSSGRAPDCHFEYLLNKTRAICNVPFTSNAVIQLDAPSRIATTFDDAEYMLGQAASVGSRSFGFGASHVGISVANLKAHGKTLDILEAVRNWKAVSKIMTDEQRATIKSTDFAKTKFGAAGSNFPQADLFYHLEKGKKEFKVIPTRVLTRKQGDTKWFYGQEHGVVQPKQFVKPGETIELENTYAPQPARFIIRVMWALDYENPENMLLQPDLKDLQNRTDTQIAAEGKSLAFAAKNTRDADWWAENPDGSLIMPYWERTLDMTPCRGVGAWITGDGKGGILILNISGNGARDFAIPINFTGRRYVEIPSGQVAWAMSDWGYRFSTSKFCSLAAITKLSLGFGKLPKGCDARITVEGLKALKETTATLENPIIKVGNGTAAISGTVESGQYLVYEKGARAQVYDKNWNKIKDLPIKLTEYTMPTGFSPVQIDAPSNKTQPWLEVQFKTSGEAMRIPLLQKR